MALIQSVSYVVEDYQEAMDWFIRCLDFIVLVDQTDGSGNRFVKIAPAKTATIALVLSKVMPGHAVSPGQQANGVFLFLETDQFERDYQAMRNNGVTFLESPRDESYAKVAIFEDLYGNKWDLIQPKPQACYSL